MSNHSFTLRCRLISPLLTIIRTKPTRPLITNHSPQHDEAVTVLGGWGTVITRSRTAWTGPRSVHHLAKALVVLLRHVRAHAARAEPGGDLVAHLQQLSPCAAAGRTVPGYRFHLGGGKECKVLRRMLQRLLVVIVVVGRWGRFLDLERNICAQLSPTRSYWGGRGESAKPL